MDVTFEDTACVTCKRALYRNSAGQRVYYTRNGRNGLKTQHVAKPVPYYGLYACTYDCMAKIVWKGFDDSYDEYQGRARLLNFKFSSSTGPCDLFQAFSVATTALFHVKSS